MKSKGKFKLTYDGNKIAKIQDENGETIGLVKEVVWRAAVENGVNFTLLLTRVEKDSDGNFVESICSFTPGPAEIEFDTGDIFIGNINKSD